MNKKILLAVTLFVFLLFAIPMMQILFFSQQTAGGKIEIDRTIEAPYLSPLKNEFTLLFFGYVGCTKICTPILQEMGKLYDSKEFQPLKPYVGVTFVNLMPEVTPEQPREFAHSFNPDFHGVYLNQQTLMSLDRTFNVFFSKSLSDKGEIDHSDSIYLLYRGKEGKIVLKNIYATHPLNKSQIVSDIQQLKSEEK